MSQKDEVELDLEKVKITQLTNLILKQTKGFLLNLNPEPEDGRYKSGIEIHDLYFNSCKLVGLNQLFCFNNANEEPAIIDGKKEYSLHHEMSFYLDVKQIKSIQELDKEEWSDVFFLNCQSIYLINMAKGDSIILGLL